MLRKKFYVRREFFYVRRDIFYVASPFFCHPPRQKWMPWKKVPTAWKKVPTAGDFFSTTSRAQAPRCQVLFAHFTQRTLSYSTKRKQEAALGAASCGSAFSVRCVLPCAAGLRAGRGWFQRAIPAFTACCLWIYSV